MENYKKRKVEENNMDSNITQMLINNQEKMISYIYQIGGICENTFHTLGNIQDKLEKLNEKLEKIELKSNYLENSINKVNHSFIQELKNKDLEIESLKELNKNMSEEYHTLIQLNSSNHVKKDNSSFYL
jgi:hypothetical protein